MGALNSPAFATISRSSPGIYPSFPSAPGFFYNSPKQMKKGERNHCNYQQILCKRHLSSAIRSNSSTEVHIEPNFHKSTVSLRIRKLRTSAAQIHRENSS